MVKPVTLITGFLGAGKTTFLNELLQSRPEVRCAIIENEYGDESIDAALLVQAADDLVSLNNGCLCCTLNDNLYDLLNALAGRADEFDELVIETTGIADPAGVAAPFLTSPQLRRDFPLARVICLVDPRFIEDRLRDTEEAIRQIAFSDLILITRTDLPEAGDVAALARRLAAINPFAQVFTGHKGRYPLAELLAARRATVPVVPTRAGAPAHNLHRHSDIVSLNFRFERPFNLATLRHRLMGFLLFQAEGVYRIKGFIHAADTDERVLLQSVSTAVAFEAADPWPAHEPRLSRLVFIGRRLKPEGIQRMLEQCLA